MKPTTGFELREHGDGSLHLNGYACVTGVSYPVGFYAETIAPQAFKRTLNNPDLDCSLLIGHTGLPLARTTSGTLRLREDNTGLLVDADLDPQDADVQSLERKMRRGDVTEMSFGFRVVDQDWNDTYDKRLIRSVDLHKGDVSVVGYGANDATSAHIRARGTLGERTTSAHDLPFEQRRRLAEDIGKRATGGGRLDLARATSGDCDRCHGNRTITTACPSCRGGSTPARSMVPEYIPNYTVRARIQLAALTRPKRLTPTALNPPPPQNV